MMSFHKTLPIFLALILGACAGNPEKDEEQTLADLDVSDESVIETKTTNKTKTKEEVKNAYYSYLQNASKTDKSRVTAINRIANMELELSESLGGGDEKLSAAEQDQRYNAKLQNTVTLLETSIRDFPDAPEVDKSLYQLARTLSQLGDSAKANSILQQLVDEHPKSVFYAEAQFRLAETAFASGDYITAENAYTEAIASQNNRDFYEKSLFKRGWSRYKQELYLEGIDDFVAALTTHQFAEREKLSDSEKNLFDDYFRALGLSFINYNGPEGLNQYFAETTDFKYVYETYHIVSDIYLKQERYTDAAATLKEFIKHHPSDDRLPTAHLEVVKIWQSGNFVAPLNDEIETFYSLYNVNSNFWKKNPDKETQKHIKNELRQYVVLMSTFYHSQYNKKPDNKNFASAEIWYKRYLADYQSYARQDNIFVLYAELLADVQRNVDALVLFEKAAYDGELILDKKSAYATISMSDTFFNSTADAAKTGWLNKHIEYVLRYVKLYPTDDKSAGLVVHAAQLAFNNKNYEKAIELANLLNKVPDQSYFTLGNIKARSYLELADYQDAEMAFADLGSKSGIDSKQREQIQNSAALAIYRQAEAAAKDNQISAAITHYGRIAKQYPTSDLAPTGLYDAIALALKEKRWDLLISHSQEFQKLYPKHARANEVNRQLSVAYLESNQNQKAAQQLENLAKTETDDKVKMAALWKAGELYESKKDYAGAIRSYRDYIEAYPNPYPQAAEAMYRLMEIYKSTGDVQKRFYWQTQIRTRDTRASAGQKTDRTNFIAASAILDLALLTQNEFKRVRLVEPFAQNLKTKKTRMQEAITLFGQASAYNQKDVTTHATFSIAEIYQEFSQALLKSERPSNLKGEELEQYNILLEDQAFPFEEKAIEFYEVNLGRVRDGTYNQWIENSFTQLRVLFPVRFNRKGKAEVINHAL